MASHGYIRIDYTGSVSDSLRDYLGASGVRPVSDTPLILVTPQPGLLLGRIARFLCEGSMGVRRIELRGSRGETGEAGIA
ncbi:MAG: hypothetical protein AB1645_05915 [Bacillota bacterium]|jgi:hypothetical protein